MKNQSAKKSGIAEGLKRGDKNEVVVRGYHPEMALIHTGGYDNSDPYLESKPRPKHLAYNGPKPVKLDDPRPR